MRRYYTFLFFICVLLSIHFIMKTLEKKHNTSYKVNKWEIKESFHLEEDHTYDFVVKKENLDYIFTIHHNFKKAKKVIKSIKVYEQEELTCIVPTYKKSIEKRIYCIQGEQQVSNEVLKNNKSFKEITKKLKVVNIPTKETKPTTYENLKVYKKNILENNTFIIWNYKGMYLLNNKEIINKKILDYDLYDNIMSTQTSRYFVLFENTNVKGIENIYYYDRKKNKLKTYHPEIIMSKDSYINGVIKDIIYVTDNKKQIEYKIDIQKETIEEIGNENIGYISFEEGKQVTKNHRDFFKEKQIFNQNKTIKLVGNKMMYQNKVLLFEMEDIKDWKVVGEDILILKEDVLYCYNEKNGLQKIVEYNELKYNYENIYTLWKE